MSQGPHSVILSTIVDGRDLSKLRYLDVTKFLALFSPIAALITWRAVLLWNGKVSLFTDPHVIQGTSFFQTIKRYQSSVPSIAVAFWALIPAAILTHYSEVERAASARGFLDLAQWPFWLISGGFFVTSLTIQFFGSPTVLVPPPMRDRKTLD